MAVLTPNNEDVMDDATGVPTGGKAGPEAFEGKKKKKTRRSHKKKATKPNGKAMVDDDLSTLDKEDESSSFERASALDRLGDPKQKKPRTSAFDQLQDTWSAWKGDLRDKIRERREESSATSKACSEERHKAIEDKEAVELWRMFDRLERRLDAQNPYYQAVFSEVTPFSKRVMSCPLLENYKTPQIKAYNGTTDPQDHVARFGANVVLYAYLEEIKCRSFLATLEGQACEWFHKLPKGSIDKWNDLAHKFLEHFASSRRQKIPFSHVLNVKIRKREQLREFINRWEKEARDVLGADDQALIMMLQEALPQVDVRKELRRNPLPTYQEMLARAKYLALEEEDDEVPVHKEKKGGQRAGEGRKRKDLGRGPNPTGYQASRPPIHAVQSLPAPPRNRESYSVQDAPKYCEYHRNSIHNTSECVTLKKEMDQLISRGLPPRAERQAPGNRTWRRPAAAAAAITNGAGQADGRRHLGRDCEDLDEDERQNRWHLGCRFIMGGNTGGDSASSRKKWKNMVEIKNVVVHCTLVDTGSLVNIMYSNTFKELGLSRADLKPIRTPLSGFTRDTTEAEGTILVKAGVEMTILKRIGEGQSTSRPPLFDGTNYSYWKERMRIYIRSTTFQLWLVIKNGEEIPMKKVDDKLIPKTKDEFDAEDIKKIENYAKAINMLYCAVNPDDYRKISCCTTAKEMWDKLEVTYEGIDQVREAKIDFLTQEYEMFRMKEGEKIDDIVSHPNGGQKPMQSTNPSESQNVTIDGLRGNLKTYEFTILTPSLDEQKKKGIALKATKETVEEVSSDDDNEFGLVIKKFHKFMKKEFERKGRKHDGPPKCYGCGEIGHIKPRCPKAKHRKDKPGFKKQRAYISWRTKIKTTTSKRKAICDDLVDSLERLQVEDDEENTPLYTNPQPQHEETPQVMVENEDQANKEEQEEAQEQEETELPIVWRTHKNHPLDQGYDNLDAQLHQAGLWPFVSWARKEINPALIRVFYSNLRREGDVLYSLVKSTPIELSVEQLGCIAGLPYQGDDVSHYGGEDWVLNNDGLILNELGITELIRNASGRPTIHSANPEGRHVLYIVSRIIKPRKHGHTIMSGEDLKLIHAIMHSAPINWAKFVMINMTIAASTDHDHLLPYPFVVMDILERFRVTTTIGPLTKATRIWAMSTQTFKKRSDNAGPTTATATAAPRRRFAAGLAEPQARANLADKSVSFLSFTSYSKYLGWLIGLYTLDETRSLAFANLPDQLDPEFDARKFWQAHGHGRFHSGASLARNWARPSWRIWHHALALSYFGRSQEPNVVFNSDMLFFWSLEARVPVNLVTFVARFLFAQSTCNHQFVLCGPMVTLLARGLCMSVPNVLPEAASMFRPPKHYLAQIVYNKEYQEARPRRQHTIPMTLRELSQAMFAFQDSVDSCLRSMETLLLTQQWQVEEILDYVREQETKKAEHGSCPKQSKRQG
ncbi:unnamed protein product [Cuscuta campestris]|uniref:CCHC-type domain-containing protein n=1 Tax=Cuscuta campestris TaxID=132261 RepID=A0A484N4I2_9ASTE|nr:unnamed protein product [Cuscuta campestris]